MSAQLSMLADLPGENPKMPSEPIARDAWVEGPYRFTLTRQWGAGPTVLWCGLNPSLANAGRDDPTMLREIGFSYRWGYGGLIKVNIYPFISPDPNQMLAWRKTWEPQDYYDTGMRPWALDKSPYAAWQHNMATIIAAIGEDTVCVAAWGNGAEGGDLTYFLENVTRRVVTSEHDGFGIVGVPIDWHCLGTNRDGSPRHTLSRGRNRVPDDTKPILWNPR